MNMKVIIAGLGKVGLALVQQLLGEGHDITVIDQRPAVLSHAAELYDIMAVNGNCASAATLNQAVVGEADLLLAVTNADEINLLCCATAHGLNPNLKTIGRIRSPDYSEQIYTMQDVFGLSLAVNPELQAAIEIERLLKLPGFLKRDAFAKGRVEIVELKVDAASKLNNAALSDLPHIIRCQVLVCAVLRAGKAIAPTGSCVLREGDRIYVTAPTANLTLLLKNLGVLTHRVSRIMICGGGPVSYYLAKRLEKSGIKVRIVEQNYERCTFLAERLPEATIVQGDASSQQVLDSAHIDACDALIAATGMDEMNMIIALYAKQRGISHVFTKIAHLDQTTIWDLLPLGRVISPKELCGSMIAHYARGIQNQAGAAVALHMIAEGQVEALEFVAEPGTRHCGEPLKQLKLRSNVLVACIIRGRTTMIPNGDSCFRQGDTVIIVSNGEHKIHQLNDIFAG